MRKLVKIDVTHIEGLSIQDVIKEISGLSSGLDDAAFQIEAQEDCRVYITGSRDMTDAEMLEQLALDVYRQTQTRKSMITQLRNWKEKFPDLYEELVERELTGR